VSLPEIVSGPCLNRISTIMIASTTTIPGVNMIEKIVPTFCSFKVC